MARRPRLVAPEYPMHVTQRGHNRDIVFHDEFDFAKYRELLHRESVRTGCSIHAYALMSNHVHLLLTPTNRLGPSRFMQRVGSQFVRYWNKRHRRSGTLWEGRFWSCIIDDDRYFLQCCRYIDMNPVEAGVVRQADEYEWSSHRHLALGIEDRLVVPHITYLALAPTAELRHRAYSAYCRQETPAPALQEIRSATRAGSAAGGPRFVARIERLLARPVTRLSHGGDRKGSGWQRQPNESRVWQVGA